MTIDQTPIIANLENLSIGIAWCLAWGDKRESQINLAVLQQMRLALKDGKQVPEETQSLVEQVEKLQNIPKDYFLEQISQIQKDYPDLW